MMSSRRPHPLSGKSARLQFWQAVVEPRISALISAYESTDPFVTLPVTKLALEEEEHAIHTILSRVRTEMNNLSPGHRIPEEILRDIFKMVAVSEPVPNGLSTWYSRDRERRHWTKLLSVCSKWRFIALASPELWTRIPLGLGSLRLQAFLARSGSVPIALTLDHDGELPSRLMNQVVGDQFARVTELVLSVLPEQEALDALVKRAPLLETFRIFPHLKGPEKVLPGPGISLPIRSKLFRRHAPHLRTVSLRGLSQFPGRFPFVQALVAFEVSRGISISQYLFPSHELFRATLRKMTNLEELTLHGCLPNVSGFQPPEGGPTHRLQLPHLRRLSLSGKLLQCARVLEDMSFPQSCHLSVACFLEASGNGEPAWLVEPSLLVQGLLRTGFLSHESIVDSQPSFFRSLRILSWGSDRVRIGTWREVPQTTHTRGIGFFAQQRCDLDIDLTYLESVGLPETLRQMALPTGSLEELWVDGTCFSSAQEWTTVFGPCPRLRSVYSFGRAGQTLIRALRPDDPNADIPFPTLSHLSVHRDVEFEDDYIGELDLVWKVLMKMLQGRVRAGHPVGQVRLHPATVKEYWVEYVEGRVDVEIKCEDIQTNTPQEEDSRWNWTKVERKVPHEY